jgi:hypothetical protein
MPGHGPYGLRQAMKDYARLCAAGDSGPYNRVSGVVIIRDALTGSPRIAEVLSVLAEATTPLTVLDLIDVMGARLDGSATGTHLWFLHGLGLVTRVWKPNPRGGPTAIYTLSPLGRLVMQKESRCP